MNHEIVENFLKHYFVVAYKMIFPAGVPEFGKSKCVRLIKRCENAKFYQQRE